MTQVVFATLLGQVARSRAALPGHRSPEPTAFVGDELAAWRESFRQEAGLVASAPHYEVDSAAVPGGCLPVPTWKPTAGEDRVSRLASENADTPASCRIYEITIEMQLASAFEAGQRCARETSRVIENPWRSDCPHHAAWQKGFDGKEYESCPMAMANPMTTNQRMTSEQTTATTHPIDLVAIDFLNLLVRCFHVGQPSDVHGVRGLLTCVAKIIRTLKPGRLVFAADGGYLHRTQILATYKAHRPPKPPELVAQIELAETAIAAIGWPLIRVVGFEADDVLASIVVRSLRDRESESRNDSATVIVSTDKDLLQLLPRCRVWNPFGDAGGWQTADSVREKFGCELHQLGDWLALVGDSSDGIPGAAGIGEKTATKLLAEFGDIETAVAQSAMGKIPGALGKKLKSAECWSQIEQSRKLLSLVETLPVCESMEKCADIEQPRVGWESRLQSLRLFGAIKPLAEAFESLSGERSPGSLTSTGSSPVPTATRPPRLLEKCL